MNQLLIIPGMDDKTSQLEWLMRHWPEQFDTQPTFYPYGWEDPVETYDEKQANLIETAEHLATLGPLAVWGASAGGHKAIDLLAMRPDIVRCAINSCGFSRLGDWQGGSERHALLRRSLKQLATKSIPTERVLTFRPRLDELVPVRYVPVEGATNIRMFTGEHMLSILWTFTGRRQTALKFIYDHTRAGSA